MAGSWKYEGDWADQSGDGDDEQAFDDAPTPEDLEAEPDDEGEDADPNCEGIIRDESPEHWEHEFAPVRGRSRMEFPESRSDESSEQGEPYLAKPRSFMNRPTTAWNGERKARKLVKPDEVWVGFAPQERRSNSRLSPPCIWIVRVFQPIQKFGFCFAILKVVRSRFEKHRESREIAPRCPRFPIPRTVNC